jgi:asparagine synthase (glutamine-hydrolysing)
MSGILGLIYHDHRSVESRKLEKMSAAIAHRGLDDQGLWLSGHVGFGHRMLWTTPASLLEKLPAYDINGQIAITADIRLDNRADLIDQLGLKHHSPDKLTDAQLVITAYRQWGQACTEHLLGDFAFALWDENAQHLFCARDHFGIKPLYFYCCDHLFAFASEIKALLALEEIPKELNEVRVADYLTGTLDDPAITLYKNIWRLPSAHSLLLRRSQAPRQTQYWQLDPSREVYHSSNEEYAEEYRHHFTEAVRCRMSSAYPVGAHLSGGLDSSSVACMAQFIRQQTSDALPIHTFSHTYPDVPDSDEREFIEIVLNQGNFIHHDSRGDTLGALTEWENLFHATDSSLIGNAYFMRIVTRAAQNDGVRILMSGFDGDTVVGHGYLSLTELAQTQQWGRLVDEAQQFIYRYRGADKSASRFIAQHSIPALKQLAQSRQWIAFAKAVKILAPALKVSQKKLWYELGFKEIDGIRELRQRRAKRRNSAPPVPFPFANAQFLSDIDYAQRLQDLKIPSSPPQSEREAQWRTLTSGLMAVPVEICDHLSADCSVETRHPFMDKRLVEYCLALPAHQKLSQGWARSILRRGMEGILPPEIQWRSSKGSSTAVFFHGLQKYNRPLLDDVVNQDFKTLERYINLSHCQESYQRIIHEQDQDIEGLWFVITLALWFRQANLN